MKKAKLLVSITGESENYWKAKLSELENRNIKEVGLFLEKFEREERVKIYEALKHSCIESIPLVHLRHDMVKGEIKFLRKNYGTEYFTIHESHFDFLEKWRGFYKYLYLEMNTDNFVSQRVNVRKIGGFCIDLAHFKVSEEKWTKEFEYIVKRMNVSRYFACNHLSGYSYEKNKDAHFVSEIKQFDYLKTLPEFVFGKVICLEVDNSISEQLKFREYIKEIMKGVMEFVY